MKRILTVLTGLILIVTGSYLLVTRDPYKTPVHPNGWQGGFEKRQIIFNPSRIEKNKFESVYSIILNKEIVGLNYMDDNGGVMLRFESNNLYYSVWCSETEIFCCIRKVGGPLDKRTSFRMRLDGKCIQYIIPSELNNGTKFAFNEKSYLNSHLRIEANNKAHSHIDKIYDFIRKNE